MKRPKCERCGHPINDANGYWGANGKRYQSKIMTCLEFQTMEVRALRKAVRDTLDKLADAGFHTIDDYERITNRPCVKRAMKEKEAK